MRGGIDVKLTLEELAYLGKIFEEKNQLGLLSNVNVPLKGDEEKLLTKKGVIENGELTLGMDIFLSTIAKPDRVCRFISQAGYLVVEKYGYWKDGRTVLAESSGDGFVFSIDSDLTAVKGQLVDLFGGANLKTTSVSLQLAKDELLTFAALVDLYRKEELLGYLSDGQSSNSFSLEELKSYVQQPMKNGFLTFLQRNFEGFSAPFDVNRGVFELKKKSILVGDEKLTFNFECALFAKNFLLVHSVSLLEVLNLKNGGLIVSSVIFLNASVHDVLRIQLMRGEMDLLSVTSRQQIDEILWALSCPQLEVEGG